MTRKQFINPVSPEIHSRRCKLVGGGVLVVGLVAAGIVYWLGMRSAKLADDASMSGYYKAEAHQMGVMYGSEGVLMDDLSNSLKQPGTQAVLIVAGSVVVALGCFVFARFPALEEEGKGEDRK